MSIRKDSAEKGVSGPKWASTLTFGAQKSARDNFEPSSDSDQSSTVL